MMMASAMRCDAMRAKAIRFGAASDAVGAAKDIADDMEGGQLDGSRDASASRAKTSRESGGGCAERPGRGSLF